MNEHITLAKLKEIDKSYIGIWLSLTLTVVLAILGADLRLVGAVYLTCFILWFFDCVFSDTSIPIRETRPFSNEQEGGGKEA